MKKFSATLAILTVILLLIFVSSCTLSPVKTENALAEKQTQLLTALNQTFSSYNQNNYTSENWQKVSDIYGEFCEVVTNAKTIDELPMSLVQQFITKLNEVETLMQKQEVDLETLQTTTLIELDKAYNLYHEDSYSEENYLTIISFYNTAKQDIIDSTNEDELTLVVTQFTQNASDIVTLAEQNAVELSEMKEQTLTSLAVTFQQYDSNNYSKENYALITTIYTNSVADIASATTTDEVQYLASSFEKEANDVAMLDTAFDLVGARADTVKELEQLLSNYDENSYSKQNFYLIYTAFENACIDANKATSQSELDGLVGRFTATADLIEKDNVEKTDSTTEQLEQEKLAEEQRKQEELEQQLAEEKLAEEQRLAEEKLAQQQLEEQLAKEQLEQEELEKQLADEKREKEELEKQLAEQQLEQEKLAEEQKLEEEKALATQQLLQAKNDGEMQLRTLLNGYNKESYSSENYLAILNNYIVAVDTIATATNSDTIDSIVADFATYADNILTIAEEEQTAIAQQQKIEEEKALATQQLTQAKNNGEMQLRTLLNGYNKESYSSKNYLDILNNYIVAVDTIATATNSDTIDSIVADFATYANSVLTIKEQLALAKQQTTDELNKLLNDYNEEHYSQQDYKTITDSYSHAIDTINNATAIGELTDITSDFLTAIDGIVLLDSYIFLDSSYDQFANFTQTPLVVIEWETLPLATTIADSTNASSGKFATQIAGQPTGEATFYCKSDTTCTLAVRFQLSNYYELPNTALELSNFLNVFYNDSDISVNHLMLESQDISTAWYTLVMNVDAQCGSNVLSISAVTCHVNIDCMFITSRDNSADLSTDYDIDRATVELYDSLLTSQFAFTNNGNGNYTYATTEVNNCDIVVTLQSTATFNHLQGALLLTVNDTTVSPLTLAVTQGENTIIIADVAMIKGTNSVQLQIYSTHITITSVNGYTTDIGTHNNVAYDGKNLDAFTDKTLTPLHTIEGEKASYLYGVACVESYLAPLTSADALCYLTQTGNTITFNFNANKQSWVTIAIRYHCASNHYKTLDSVCSLAVNGNAMDLSAITATSGSNSWATFAIDTSLLTGQNTVTLSYIKGIMPDIDVMYIYSSDSTLVIS